MVIDVASAQTEALARALTEAGGVVRLAHAVPEAIAALIDAPADVVLCSVELPGESGVAVLQHLHDSGTPVLMLTSEGDPAQRALHFGRGADDVIVRPFDVVDVVARVRRRLAVAAALRAAKLETGRLHALAVTDGLTGVANFRFFQDRLREEFRRAQRYDTPLALVMMDLDHFKAVNDNFGHQVGDEVLMAAARTIKAAVRETDIVARYGGEEFAMLLPQTHLAGALTVAERVATGLQALTLATPGLRVTGSFGISGFPCRGVSTAEQLVRTADLALYRAKHEGRNKISLFQSTMATGADTGQLDPNRQAVG